MRALIGVLILLGSECMVPDPDGADIVLDNMAIASSDAEVPRAEPREYVNNVLPFPFHWNPSHFLERLEGETQRDFHMHVHAPREDDTTTVQIMEEMMQSAYETKAMLARIWSILQLMNESVSTIVCLTTIYIFASASLLCILLCRRRRASESRTLAVVQPLSTTEITKPALS